MNKADLIDSVVAKTGLSKAKSREALDAVVDSIMEGVGYGEDVTLVGFGTFSVRHRAQRKGRNPRSGEEITIKAAKIPGFKPGKQFKDIINN